MPCVWLQSWKTSVSTICDIRCFNFPARSGMNRYRVNDPFASFIVVRHGVRSHDHIVHHLLHSGLVGWGCERALDHALDDDDGSSRRHNCSQDTLIQFREIQRSLILVFREREVRQSGTRV